MDDLISRQQAIDAIMGEYPDAHYPDWYASKIRALPSAQPEERTEKRTESHACGLISRQAAIDAVSKHNFDYPQYMERFVTELRDAMKADLKHDIEELPSAQPYTVEEIDKMQELESVQMEKAYELGMESAQSEKQHGRIFQEIVVEYPSYNTYPEYKGKPYFSIKYTENGQEFIGYGTYKPEVLSEYLKEYFMPSAQPELDPEALIRTIEMGITAINLNDIYSIGMRNGMRWCKSLIDGVEPKFEGYVMSVGDWKKLPSAQSERKTGTWIPQDFNKSDGMKTTTVYYFPKCSVCGYTASPTNYCPHCGADMKGSD